MWKALKLTKEKVGEDWKFAEKKVREDWKLSALAQWLHCDCSVDCEQLWQHTQLSRCTEEAAAHNFLTSKFIRFLEYFQSPWTVFAGWQRGYIINERIRKEHISTNFESSFH